MDKKSVFTSKSFLSARGMTKIFMAFAIIGFSMPFLTVSCGTNMITSVSGYELITGKDLYLVDKWAGVPMNIMILLAFITCIITLVAAFLPQYPQSRVIWGASSAVGLMILVMYYLSAVGNVMQEVARRIAYDVSAQMVITPGRGLILCMLLQVSSLIMLIRKSFFEEPDLLPLTIDETEIIKTIEEEAQEEAKERELLHRELAEKLAPIEQKYKAVEAKQTTEQEDEPEAETASESKTELTVEIPMESATQPVAEPVTQTATTPTVESATETAPEPTSAPPLEPTTELTSEPIAESAQETPTVPTTEPVSETAQEPTRTPTVEPTLPPTSETAPKTPPTPETASEPTSEVSYAPPVESTSETAPEPTPEPAVPQPEPNSAPKTPPTPETTSEPASVPKTDSEPIPTYESIPKPPPMVEQEPTKGEEDES